MDKGTLICIVGPTAIGKTNLAIKIAKKLNTEIISSDSRQFYKEMHIGTAVPSIEELNKVPHHFIQNKSILREYNVGDFEKEAIPFIESFLEKKQTLVMVGGSGLYEKAITEGLNYFPDILPHIEQKLNQEFIDFGLEKLKSELKEKDYQYYQITDIDNPRRVIRALGVIRTTGETFSKYRNMPLPQRNFKFIKIGLSLPREKIYERINLRVELMIKNGLLKEAQELYIHKNLKALQTVGYQELFSFFEGKINLKDAIEEIKKNTRRFAKRQLTWYRKDKTVKWFTPNDYNEILKYIETQKI